MLSIIIRTYNEEKYIAQVIQAIYEQVIDQPIEIIIVDSGSTDGTVGVAARYLDVRIFSIRKEFFSYGYALNYGLSQAKGEIAISISAHCLPIGKQWLSYLIEPLSDPLVAITYGRQLGASISRLSERRVFAELFPRSVKNNNKLPFSHNANSAFKIKVWRECPFDETLKGLEDQDYALKVSKKGLLSVYVPKAAIYHFHEETNEKVFNRYYREALSLMKVRPHKPKYKIFIFSEFVYASLGDILLALKERQLMTKFLDIMGYRLSQYFAIYIANHGVKFYGIKFFIQNWFIKKISKGSSDLFRFENEKILRRAFEK